jgi:hypothetical protein
MERHGAGMDFEYCLAAGFVRRADGHLAVETARTHQCRVENLGAVRRREHDYTLAATEPVHFGEDLVERLLTLVVASKPRAAPSRTPDSIQLVDEDDGRSELECFSKEVSDPACANPDNHLNKFRR